MKFSSLMETWFQKVLGDAAVRPATRAERGQALVIVAMAMIGLLAFVGLTVDAGILFIGEGHLRRAVDAAALAAAGQFRQGRTFDQLEQSAKEVIHLNGVEPTSLHMYVCAPGDPHNDDSLCPAPGAPHRKFVKVVATSEVRFAFLGIIGFPSTQIIANSTTEAASVDVVLVLDTSNSMTFGVAGEINGGWQSDGFHGDQMWNPSVCNVATPPDPQDQAGTDTNPPIPYKGNCLPFHYVQKAAVDFINHLYFPYDRLAIVTFDRLPSPQIPLTNTLSKADILSWVKGNPVSGIGDGLHGLQVSDPKDRWYPSSGCTYEPYNQPTGDPNFPAPQSVDPSACQNTSTGGGLAVAGSEFGRQPIRQEAVWVVILLTDGAANASRCNPALADPCSQQINQFCPQSTWWDPNSNTDPRQFNPLCRDTDPISRHTVLTPTLYSDAGIDPGHSQPYNPNSTFNAAKYDADDYARDNADFVSCPAKLAQAPKWCRDSLDYTHNRGGQGAVMYAIGLGPLVIDTPRGGGYWDDACDPQHLNSICYHRLLPSNPQAGYSAGDALLRYVANVGIDGNPDPNDPTSLDPCSNNTNPVPPPALIAQGDNQPTIPPGNLSYNCGNYYFAQFGTGLTSVFQSIASRIFTRITQ